MIWGYFSHHGVGALQVIDRIMNKNIYRYILIDNLQYSVDLIEIGAWFVFQQDLDSEHTAPAARDFFPENDVRQLPWAPQSLDTNPVENLWSILDAVVAISECVSKARFFALFQQCWYDLGKELLKKLVESIPTRLLDIIRAKGGPTGY